MSDSSSSDDGEETWIQWFCGLEGHESFCEVDRSYIEDGFNLYGLRHWVPSINDSLDVILDRVCECALLSAKHSKPFRRASRPWFRRCGSVGCALTLLLCAYSCFLTGIWYCSVPASKDHLRVNMNLRTIITFPYIML